jgi:hypothetical protein
MNEKDPKVIIKAKGRPRDRAPAPSDHALAGDLAEILERVGPSNYARATARDFAPGGRYHGGRRRQRYALM